MVTSDSLCSVKAGTVIGSTTAIVKVNESVLQPVDAVLVEVGEQQVVVPDMENLYSAGDPVWVMGNIPDPDASYSVCGQPIRLLPIKGSIKGDAK